jgi:hypothetical protein
MAFRHEHKYTIPFELVSEFRCFLKLHPALFRPIHHPRNVNSIYLETEEFDHFNRHVEGGRHREKFRIRWYGDLTGRITAAQLEVKIKHNQMNAKRRHPLPEFELPNDNPWQGIRAALEAIPADRLDRETALAQRPYALVRYHRCYHLSSDRKCRITIDTRLEWYSAGIGGSRLKKEAMPPHAVVELKYDRDDTAAAGDVSSLIPSRYQRHSKYLHAVRAIYPW